MDYANKLILVTSPTTEVDAQTLHDFVEDELAKPPGLQYPDDENPILKPEGKIEDPSNPGIFSQIILILNSLWQIQFWGGSGYTRIYGGKIVGGVSDQPLKATGTAGDISVLESPVDGVYVKVDVDAIKAVSDDIYDIVVDILKLTGNKVTRSGDVITIYEDDAITPWRQYNLANRERIQI